MSWLFPTEREKWATPAGCVRTRPHVGLPALDARSRELYERALPRGVMVPRFTPDQSSPSITGCRFTAAWRQYGFMPGQIILGKLGAQHLGYIDDRPQITIAGARAGKTSTSAGAQHLPLSRLDAGPRGRRASWRARRICAGRWGTDVYVLDPFPASRDMCQCQLQRPCLNSISRARPWSTMSQRSLRALVVDDGDAKVTALERQRAHAARRHRPA